MVRASLKAFCLSELLHLLLREFTFLTNLPTTLQACSMKPLLELEYAAKYCWMIPRFFKNFPNVLLYIGPSSDLRAVGGPNWLKICSR